MAGKIANVRVQKQESQFVRGVISIAGGKALFHSVLGRFGVCRQAFAARKLGGNRTEPACTVFRYADDARALLEIINAQRRRKTRRARSRQHMVRSRAVIAERLRRVAAEEYRAGVPDSLEQSMRVGDRKFEVLRGDA